jgi:hypothetical protein
MLDDDHGVTEIAKLTKGCEESRVVTLMQAYRRLIQNVQHANESRSNLCRETNALRFSAGKRFG